MKVTEMKHDSMSAELFQKSSGEVVRLARAQAQGELGQRLTLVYRFGQIVY